MATKPKARRGGRRPQAKGPSFKDARAASESRGRIKARLLSLTGRISTLESMMQRLESLISNEEE